MIASVLVVVVAECSVIFICTALNDTILKLLGIDI
jgi:hypothetical protein